MDKDLFLMVCAFGKADSEGKVARKSLRKSLRSACEDKSAYKKVPQLFGTLHCAVGILVGGFLCRVYKLVRFSTILRLGFKSVPA